MDEQTTTFDRFILNNPCMRVHEEVQEGIYKCRSGQGWTGAAQLSTMSEALSYATLSPCFGPITIIIQSTTALQSQGSDVKC